MANYFIISGYWKDDKIEFSGYIVSEDHTLPSEGDLFTDDQIFYYGLHEKAIKNAIEAKENTAHDFVITSYEKVADAKQTEEKPKQKANEDSPREYTPQELRKIYQAMTTYGGSFVKALSEAFWRADHDNEKRLILAFPDILENYFETYVKSSENE